MSADDDNNSTNPGSPSLVAEEPTSPTSRVTWSSYLNLAKLVFDLHKAKETKPGSTFTIQQFFQMRCTATEKVDGSNIGILVRYALSDATQMSDVAGWEVLLLQGRNAPLYTSPNYVVPGADDDDSKATAAKEKKSDDAIKKEIEASFKKITSLPGYGNAGSLGQLPRKMRDFAARVANELSVTELQVFGEAYRGKTLVDNAKGSGLRTEAMATFASFHPFGVKLPTQAWRLLRLSKALHELFSKAAQIATPPKSHDEFTNMLVASQDHVVVPPVLFAAAEPVVDVVERLSPVFLTSKSRYFEGVFLVFESDKEGAADKFVTAGGAKYKTGTHCEMAAMASVEDLGLVGAEKEDAGAATATAAAAAASDDKENARLAAAWKMMEQVRSTKIAAEKFGKAAPPPDAGKAAKASADARAVADITTACEREFGKMATFSHVVRELRQPICDVLLPLVLKEVAKNYEESGVPMPYDQNTLKAKAAPTIKALVLKVPVDEVASKAKAAAAAGDDDDS